MLHQSIQTEKKNQNIKKKTNASKHLARRVLRILYKQCSLSHLGLLTLSSTVLPQIEQQLVFSTFTHQ